MNSIIEQIKLDICHLTDGPLTLFVIINRATELAATGQYSPYEIANSLYEIITNDNLF